MKNKKGKKGEENNGRMRMGRSERAKEGENGEVCMTKRSGGKERKRV